jgi:hypothetical protein
MGPRAKRPSLLAPFRADLHQRWDEGCRDALRLFQEREGRGFAGKRSIGVDALAQLRRGRSPGDSALSDAVVGAAPQRRTSPRQVRWWFQGKPEDREDAAHGSRDRFLAEHAEARVVDDLTRRFGRMIRERRRDDLAGWL